jgi:putative transposase
MSICAAIAYRWDGQRADLFFQMKPGSYDTDSLIAFLKDLKRQMRGKKVILIWDGLPAHKSRAMTEYLRGEAKWLTVERLPGYAPDLNPVESLWGNIKGQELANLCARDLSEAASACRKGLARVGKTDQLCFSFLENTGLSF